MNRQPRKANVGISDLMKSLPIFIAGLVPLLLGLMVHTQGFNLLDDGLWLLGSRTLADGGHLYRDLFSIYGPARYLLLLPFFMIWGQTVLALAIFKAVLDGVAGGFGYWFARRLGAGKWAWLVPVAVLALGPVYPRYVAAAVFAALVSGVLLPTVGVKKRGWILGVAWGALALFGLDMWAYGAVILASARLLGRRGIPVWGLVGAGGGMVAALVMAAIVPLASGYGGTVGWDTVVYPLTRFSGEMGHSWWQSFRASGALGQAFSGLFTGEDLPQLWAGHGVWRATAWRILFVAAWALPVLALWVVRRFRMDQLAPLVGVGFASWSTLLGRGDVDHLRLISWALVLLLAPMLGRFASRRLWVLVAAAGCLLVFGPRLGEQLWLAGHLDRPSLGHWERPTAGVRLGVDRIRELDTVLDQSGWAGDSAVVAWPAQPGLVFLLGAPSATPQMTLLAGEVRDPKLLVARLQKQAPPLVILGRSAGLVTGVRSVRQLAPEVYAFLRRSYSLEANHKSAEAVFRILKHQSGGQEAVRRLPLERQLAGDSQFVRTGTTPVLGPGQSVAQTVRVTDFDLSGVALLVGSPGPWPQEISLRLQVVAVVDGRGGKSLASIPLQVTLHEQIQRVPLAFDPVPGTVGTTVILDVSGNSDGEHPFTLFWHQADAGQGPAVDYYPEGQAFWNRTPVGGDLFFAIY